MKNTYWTYWYLLVIAMLCQFTFMSRHDKVMTNQTCAQFTYHPDCPDSWKTNP